MLYIWPLCTLLHLQVCCLLVHALHMAFLYSSTLTSLLLACTCFTYGFSVLFCTDKFVAGLYMLCDVLHTVAKLQSSLQTKDLDLPMVPLLVQTTVGRLKELKDYPSNSTWFKHHLKVFSDQS